MNRPSNALLAEPRRGVPRYLQALHQHWPYIVATVVLAVGAALAYAALAEERFSAQADILVAPVPAGDQTFAGFPVLREGVGARSVLTVARFVKTPQVADGAAKRLRLDAERDELLDLVQVAPQEQSNIVTIKAEADSAVRAADVANAFADELLARRTASFQSKLTATITRLQRQLAALPATAGTLQAEALRTRLGSLRGLVGANDPTLDVASRAVPPEEPSWPRRNLSIAVALLAGLLLGIGIAVALELLSPLVLRADEVIEEHGLPVLARVPRVGRNTRTDPTRATPPRAVRDAFRTLRANLSVSGTRPGLPRTLLVTSGMRGEGRTAVAAELGATLATAGARVVLVDADVFHPSLAGALGVEDDGGLRRFLLGESSASDALVDVSRDGDRLRLLGARDGDDELVDLLQPDRIAHLVDELEEHADVIIFDAPPLLDDAAALMLADAVEGSLVVVRLGRTRRERLAAVREVLAQRGLSPLGVVLIDRRRAPVRGQVSRSATRRPVQGRGDRSRRRARTS